MKKRIFIAIHYMELGGAEMSLIGLLHALDHARFDVDLMIYSHRGELMEMIPPEVNILPEMPEYAQIERPIRQVLKDGYWRIALARMKAKWQYKRYARSKHPRDGGAIFQYVDNAVRPHLPSLHHLGRYDLAISFLTPHGIVLDKVQAKTKAAWIHTDYSYVDINTKDEYPVWAAYDKIAAVSKDVANSFLTKFPELAKKVFIFENILSEVAVREKAKRIEGEHELALINQYEGLKLCSVGRFSYPKAFDRAVEICKYLVEDGIDCRWYIIGYGGDEGLIRAAIEKHSMKERFIIIGKKSNPYPYIDACDIYVQPSRYEGKAVTVREAQILCKPVVITAYATAQSQVSDRKDGIIVPNETKGAARGLADFIRNIPLRNDITSYLQTHHYGNEKEIEKLYPND